MEHPDGNRHRCMSAEVPARIASASTFMQCRSHARIIEERFQLQFGRSAVQSATAAPAFYTWPNAVDRDILVLLQLGSRIVAVDMFSVGILNRHCFGHTVRSHVSLLDVYSIILYYHILLHYTVLYNSRLSFLYSTLLYYTIL